MATDILEELLKNELPIASGPNVFLRSEYQKAAGIQHAHALVKLHRLEDEGRIRRVRTRRNGRLTSAWEYLKTKKAPREQRS